MEKREAELGIAICGFDFRFGFSLISAEFVRFIMQSPKRVQKYHRRIESAVAPVLGIILGASAARAQSGPYNTVTFSSVSSNAYGTVDTNSCSIDINNLITLDGYQFMAFYNNSGDIVLGRRLTSSSANNTNAWTLDTTTYTADSGSGGIADDHHTISIAVDGNGQMHMSWGMHNDAFNYAISTGSVTGATFAPSFNVESQTTMESWFPELSSIDQVTYPQFYNVPNSGNLLLVYRDAAGASGGGSGNGNEWFAVYNATTKTYSSATNVEMLDGGRTHVNGYLNNLVYTPSGTLISTWTWRASSNWETNSNLLYAQSPNNGASWYQFGGTTQYGLPIIQNTSGGGTASQVAQAVVNIPENDSYINQTSATIDNNGNPMVATYLTPAYNPSTGTGNVNRQYVLEYYNGTSWQQSVISSRTSDTSIDTQGNDVRDLGRPLVIVDKSNRVLVVTRSEDYKEGSYSSPSTPNNDIVLYYTTASALDSGAPNWRSTVLNTANMGDYEPTYDPGLWSASNILDLIYEPVGLNGEGQQTIQVLQWNENTFFQDGNTWDNAGGSGNGTSWDIAANANWNNGTGATTFMNGDNITFNDSNNGNYAVTLNTTVTPGTITVNNSLGNYVISGSGGIAGTGALTKSGGATLSLATANTYSGGTTVSAGTLVVANTSGSATGAGNVTLTGGVLASGTTGSISGNVSAAASSVIAPGGVGTIGTLSLGGLSTVAGATLNFDLGTGTGTITNGDLLNLGSGTIVIASSTNITLGSDPGISAAGNDYELIGGTISGISTSSFSLPAAPAGVAYSLSKIGGFIDLVVSSTGPVSLTWNNTGAGSPTDGVTWDTTNNNWNNGSSVTTYNDGTLVTFNDTNNNHYAVTLTSTVSPGSVTVNNSLGNYTITGAGKIADFGSFVKTGSGTLTVGAALSVGSMSISAGTLKLATGVSGVSGPAVTSPIDLTALSITGNGVLDVNNDHLIITYGSSDPISTIANYIKSGYNGGGWNGPGIISTAALTKTNGLLYGVGYADGKDGVVAGLSSGQIEVAYTLLGDANLDGVVNSSDFAIMAANFNQSVTGWDQGDFTYTGVVNAADFMVVAVNFNQGVSGAASAGDVAALDAFAAANGISLGSVPEPASLGLFTFGSVGILARRRRRE